MLYGLLADISYANQHLKAAHEFEEKEDALRDSVNADNLQEISTEYETKYETGKKETQIKLQQVQLRQKTTLNYFFNCGGCCYSRYFIAGLPQLQASPKNTAS